MCIVIWLVFWYSIGMLDTIKLAHTIGINGLLEFSRDEKSGLSLWEDVDNNVWTWDQIIEASKLVTNEDIVNGMKNGCNEVCESAVLDLLQLVEQDDPFCRKAFLN